MTAHMVSACTTIMACRTAGFDRLNASAAQRASDSGKRKTCTKGARRIIIAEITSKKLAGINRVPTDLFISS